MKYNQKQIMALAFYGFLTYYLAPVAIRTSIRNHPDPDVAGFIIGFTLSVLLWQSYGRKLT